MLHTNKQDRCYRRLSDESIETSNFLCTYVLKTAPQLRIISYLLSNGQEVEEDFVQIWGRTYSGRCMEELRNNLDSRCASRDSKKVLVEYNWPASFPRYLIQTYVTVKKLHA